MHRVYFEVIGSRPTDDRIDIDDRKAEFLRKLCKTEVKTAAPGRIDLSQSLERMNRLARDDRRYIIDKDRNVCTLADSIDDLSEMAHRSCNIQQVSSSEVAFQPIPV